MRTLKAPRPAIVRRAAEDSIGNEQGAKTFQRIEEVSDHSNGYGSMMDFDKLY